MEELNIESAKLILEDLKRQLKEAQERVILFTGAIQGAEIIIESLKQKVNEPLLPESDTVSSKTTKGRSTKSLDKR